MKDDMSSAFQSAEFKQLLAKYESMLSNKKNVYFEADVQVLVRLVQVMRQLVML